MPYNGEADNLRRSPAPPLREDQILRQMRKAALPVRTRTGSARRSPLQPRQTLCQVQPLVVRAGGKHNDLENVGYTARHHTFFEMLGNFSFGDYFKRDAIEFAWEFLTKVLGLPEEKLWVTVHISDDEAADIWLKELGVSADRFSRLDEDNFWQMGDTGPCGPSSEIFFDHGEDVPGGPPGSENDDLDRYIEIWNLVFMQYERQTDGSLVSLPKPSVDTGMGLERIAAVMQGVHSNYDIDLFQALLQAVARETGSDDLEHKSLRVIADHIRSCSFLVCDGVLPSNEGRGYVLRRIIRRAIRHGHKLGQQEVFFHRLVGALVEQMGDAYPELKSTQAQIEKVLLTEEQQFAKTLDKGMVVLESKLAELKGKVINGETVFALYDTYGFPVDLTNDIARERGLTLDLDAYETLMAAQKQQSKDAGNFSVDYTKNLQLDGRTEFVGYEHLENQSEIIAIIQDENATEVLEADQEAAIVLDSTAFYAESGGQVGDSGIVTAVDGDARFEVRDCIKSGDSFLHVGRLLSGTLTVGQQVLTTVDPSVRASTTRNHSATHLLHAALREIVGEHVSQKGSLVDADRLRFDFSHFEAVTPEELDAISTRVNAEILANTAVTTELCDRDTAEKKGAMALFGEKYGEEVRVLTMGREHFSVELCGGTHVQSTGEIGQLIITAESGIASGVRRIEAITGERALQEVKRSRSAEQSLATQLKTTPNLLAEKLTALVEGQKQLEKEIAQLKSAMASANADEWLSEAIEINGIKLLVKSLEDATIARGSEI